MLKPSLQSSMHIPRSDVIVAQPFKQPKPANPGGRPAEDGSPLRSDSVPLEGFF